MTHGQATYPLSELVAGVQLCMRGAVQSDGYLTGLGQSLWTSSGCFERQRGLMETACGQVAFVDPLTGDVEWKNADYFEESVGDALDGSLPVEEDEGAGPAPRFEDGPFAGVGRAEILGWAARMAEEGAIPEEFAKRLRSIPILERCGDVGEAFGLVEYDAGVVESARAIPDGETALVGARAAARIDSLAGVDAELSFFGCVDYAWDQGRWMAKVEDDEGCFWLPASMALAIEWNMEHGPTRSIDAYVEAGMTSEDRSDLEALAGRIGWARMFAAVPSVQAYGARRQIEAATPLAKPAAAPALRV